MIKEIKNELMKTVLGRCIWVVILIMVGSWIATAVYNIIVLLISSVTALIAMITDKHSAKTE